jgi:hypothetical protein
MNTSNRYGAETLARQHQAEIEEHLRQTAQLRGPVSQIAPSGRLAGRSRRRLILLTLGMLITLAAAAFIV